MNKMIGELGLYTVGSPPSKIPPCAGALAVLVEVVAEIVVVTMSVTVRVAILKVDECYRS